MKRVSMDALEFDSKIAELSFAEDAETNSELTAKVKKTMAKIIKNDLTPRQREIIMLYYYSATSKRCCSFMTQEVFYNGNYKEFNNR